MPNRDRLTALDAGFLHLERSGAHMHVAGDPGLRGRRPRLRRARRGDRGAPAPGAALPPEAGPRAVRPGPPRVGRRSALQRALPRAPHRAARARLRRAAAQPRRAPVRPPAGPHQAAVGDLARRGARGRPLRAASPRPTTRSSTASAASTSPRCSSTSRPTPRRPRRGPGVGAAPEPTDAELLAEALLERATVPAEGARGAAGRSRARRARSSDRRANGSSASARWPGPGSAPRRRRRFNVPIGPHRRYTWVDAEVARFKAIKNALGGTLNDVVLSAVTLALGRFLRRRGVETDGLVLKAMVPVSVRADDAARRAGQPRRRDVGAAAGRRDGPRGGALARSHDAMAASRSPGRPWAPRC